MMFKCNTQSQKSKTPKHKKAVVIQRKVGKAFFRTLEEFLRQVPISTPNEYGEQIIRGKRIC
jgi:hypothetical protein